MIIRLTTEILLMTSKRVALGDYGSFKLIGECLREYGRRGIGERKNIYSCFETFAKEEQRFFPKCLSKPEDSMTERKPKSFFSLTF